MEDLFSKENILNILDYIEEGIHIIDNNGKIMYYNQFAQRIDGIEKGQGSRPAFTGKCILP